jgi:hypothetical protein
MSSVRPANDHEVIAELTRRTEGYGNGKRLARELGMVPNYLRSVKSGTQMVSVRLARLLGYELRWVRVREGKQE